MTDKFSKSILDIANGQRGQKLVDDIKKFIAANYAERTRPVKASIAKKLVKDKLSSKEANGVAFPEITEKLKKEREEKTDKESLQFTKQQFDKLKKWRFAESQLKLFSYLLFVSGLRLNELFSGEFEVKDGSLFVDKLSKKRENSGPFKIELLLIDPVTFTQLLREFRSKNERNLNALTVALFRLLNSEFGISTHDLRSLFVSFHLTNKKTFSDLRPQTRVKKLLHHADKNSTAHYLGKYNMAEIQQEDEREDLRKKTMAELRVLAKKMGKRGYSKLRKADLIDFITAN